jgi:hypothetical protein
MSTEDTVLVFTARSPERIVREGGSQAWVLNVTRAKACTYLVCTQNRHNPDHDFEDATEPHGAGFLVGKISRITPSIEHPDGERWIIGISEYARIEMPGLWEGWRNPVRYASLADLNIDPGTLKWQRVPEAAAPPAHQKAAAQPVARMTIEEAKKALAATFGVRPDAIEITIRG